MAYDSGFQDSDDVSPLLPTNSTWRFGVGGQQQLSKSAFWGLAADYLYGGTLDTRLEGKPVALGGRGALDGSYDDTAGFFIAAYYSGAF
jgi:hypothetical protein